ncbi:universal stress protein [Methanotrichaceae archaeon M04Ac]|uniref:Universal stress protein n=1 Tax=Candidatus Methanocrinis alkalitolerans TaxID=3033395 RepID=A0ABT5XDP9_9EURY|nr:universal stress protein [Candidatus Methanocrinis alkalitolerans]MDF0592829.1 universal stress protein [Candidatus Methanocrinis alkalitolerans]
MFEKVLVPTDFSKYAQKVIECIGDVPGLKEIVLLHVVDATHPSKRGWTRGPKVEGAKIDLADIKGRLENLGFKVTSRLEVITEADVSRTIQRVAEEEEVSLIVMGALGKGRVSGILLGSASTGVVRFSDKDTLIMRYKMLEGLEGATYEKFCPMIFSKVLCTTDFSEASQSAISTIKGLKDVVGEVILEYVVSKGEAQEEIEGYVAEAKEKLAEIEEDLESSGLKVRTHVDVGNPREQITSLATTEDVSLIVISSQGKGWIKQMMVGSTTFDVVRTAERPVLIVRSKKAA